MSFGKDSALARAAQQIKEMAKSREDVYGGFGALGSAREAAQRQAQWDQERALKQELYEKKMIQDKLTAMQQNIGLGSLGGLTQYPGAINPLPRPDPNTIPAYQMPLKDLITMWQAKFGEAWVDAHELRSDEFWTKAIDRMGAAKLFEVYAGHYRLMEHE